MVRLYCSGRFEPSNVGNYVQVGKAQKSQQTLIFRHHRCESLSLKKRKSILQNVHIGSEAQVGDKTKQSKRDNWLTTKQISVV
jgi:hypothetical protein